MQSENPALLSFHRRREAASLERAKAKAATETGARSGAHAPRSGEGDYRRLRGIPVVGGVAGVMPGTQPEHAVIRKLTPRS